MELITVIVPVYNVEQYLERCVNSIRNQTYKNLEIILVDDGSPDRCPQICDELAEQDSRIKVIHKVNGGAGFARNSGLEQASGAYVTFIDSDDWISQDHIENLYLAIQRFHADIAVGGHVSSSINGEIYKCSNGFQQDLYLKDEIINSFLMPLIGPDVDYPKDVQIEASSSMSLYSMIIINNNHVRYLSEKYTIGEDLFFNLDFLNYTERLVTTNEDGYYYFENPLSNTRCYKRERFERTINFYAMLKEKVKEYGLEDFVEHRIERSFLTRIRVAIRHIVFSNLSCAKKYTEIKEILYNKDVQIALSKYPIETFLPAVRTYSKLMRSKNVIGVIFLILIREIVRKYQRMKRSARRFDTEK